MKSINVIDHNENLTLSTFIYIDIVLHKRHKNFGHPFSNLCMCVRKVIQTKIDIEQDPSSYILDNTCVLFDMIASPGRQPHPTTHSTAATIFILKLDIILYQYWWLTHKQGGRLGAAALLGTNKRWPGIGSLLVKELWFPPKK